MLPGCFFYLIHLFKNFLIVFTLCLYFTHNCTNQNFSLIWYIVKTAYCNDIFFLYSIKEIFTIRYWKPLLVKVPQFYLIINRKNSTWEIFRLKMFLFNKICHNFVAIRLYLRIFFWERCIWPWIGVNFSWLNHIYFKFSNRI